MKTKTTLDILNMSCEQEQKVKGGIDLNQQWVPIEEAIDNVCKIEYLDAKMEEADKLIDALLKPQSNGCFSFPAPYKLKQIKCALCTIDDCSTRNSSDMEECLLINESQPMEKK